MSKPQRRHTKWIRTLAVAAITLAGMTSIVGTGGGDWPEFNFWGDPQPAPTPPPPAFGNYEGQTSDGRDFIAVVTYRDHIWLPYGIQTSDRGLVVSGFLRGDGTSRSGSYSASNLREYTNTGGVFGNVTLSASYVRFASFNGSFTSDAGTVSFTGSYQKYRQLLYPWDVEGDWSLTASTGEAVTLTITGTTGALSGSLQGCNFAGTIGSLSDDDAYGSLGITLNFGASPCPEPSRQLVGIAVIRSLDSGAQQMVVMAVSDASESPSGLALSGTRMPSSASP